MWTPSTYKVLKPIWFLQPLIVSKASSHTSSHLIYQITRGKCGPHFANEKSEPQETWLGQLVDSGGASWPGVSFHVYSLFNTWSCKYWSGISKNVGTSAKARSPGNTANSASYNFTPSYLGKEVAGHPVTPAFRPALGSWLHPVNLKHSGALKTHASASPQGLNSIVGARARAHKSFPGNPPIQPGSKTCNSGVSRERESRKVRRFLRLEQSLRVRGHRHNRPSTQKGREMREPDRGLAKFPSRIRTRY